MPQRKWTAGVRASGTSRSVISRTKGMFGTMITVAKARVVRVTPLSGATPKPAGASTKAKRTLIRADLGCITVVPRITMAYLLHHISLYLTTCWLKTQTPIVAVQMSVTTCFGQMQSKAIVAQGNGLVIRTRLVFRENAPTKARRVRAVADT